MKNKPKEQEKMITITLSEKDAKNFLSEMVLHIRVSGYSNAKEFMEMNPYYKPIISALIKAVEGKK
jgi:hypothetical protein